MNIGAKNSNTIGSTRPKTEMQPEALSSDPIISGNGVAIRRSELIGLIPRAAVETSARYYLGTL